MQGSFLPTDTEIRRIVQSVRLGPAQPPDIAPALGPHVPNAVVTIPRADPEFDAARRLDRAYVHKVVGHAMLIDISKAWVSDNPASTTLDQTLFAKLLTELLDRVSQRDLHEISINKKRARDIGHNVRHLTKELREAWEEFDNFYVSAQIQSAEDCVVQDLRIRGYFQSLLHSVNATDNQTGHGQWRDLVFVLRRSCGTCVEFARAVGAHILTHSLVANNRSSIVEHNRSYTIFENAFAGLEAAVAADSDAIMRVVHEEWQNGTRTELTADYYSDTKHRLQKMEATKKVEPEQDAVDTNRGMWDQLGV